MKKSSVYVKNFDLVLFLYAIIPDKRSLYGTKFI